MDNVSNSPRYIATIKPTLTKYASSNYQYRTAGFSNFSFFSGT